MTKRKQGKKELATMDTQSQRMELKVIIDGVEYMGNNICVQLELIGDFVSCQLESVDILAGDSVLHQLISYVKEINNVRPPYI